MGKGKNSHGGRRLNAGRKQSLSFEERMKIGSFCEAKWSAISEAAAWSEYESQPYIVDIREEQRRLSAIPVKLRIDPNSSPAGKSSEPLTVAERIDEVSQEIDAVLESES